MRKYFSLMKCMTAAVAVMMLAACQQDDNYLKVIPEDSAMMMSFDLASLAKKGDLANNVTITGAANTALLMFDRETQDYAKTLLDNPTNMGIDFTKPAVVSLTMVGNEPEVGFVMAVKDKAALRKCLETLAKDQVTLTDKGAVTVASIGGQEFFAFDEATAAIFKSERYKLTELFELPASKQAVKSGDLLKTMLDKHADFAFCCDYDKLMTLCSSVAAVQNPELDPVYKDLGEKAKGMKVLGTTNFENGKIVSKSYAYGIENLKEYDCYQPINGQFLEYLPANASVVLDFGLKNISKVAELYDKGLEGKIAAALAEENLTIADLDEICGDMCLSFNGIDPQYNMPLIFFAFDVTGDKLFQVTVEDEEKISAMGGEKIDTNVYSFNVLTHQYCVGEVDHKVFVMPLSFYSQVIKDGKWVALSDNYKQNRLASAFKGDGAMTVDFQAITDMVRNMDLGARKEPIVMATSAFDNMVVSSDSKTEATCVVEMTDKKTNSLKKIINLVEDIIRVAATQNY